MSDCAKVADLNLRCKTWSLLLALLPVFSFGCAVSTKTHVPAPEIRTAKDATKSDLLAAYNKTAGDIISLNLSVELAPTTGSAYSGVIEQYHRVNAFIIAQRPANIRVIGQDPVFSKNIFDMTSDGEMFHIYIPSKNKFIVGPANYEGTAEKPIENLRPQHLLDALFWPKIPAAEVVSFREDEEGDARYYILTVYRAGKPDDIDRELWFDRADLNLARIQIFGAQGFLFSDIWLKDWQPVESSATAEKPIYPRDVTVKRPHDDYQLGIKVTKIAINESISADRFHLAQPAGTDLVEVGNGGGSAPYD